MATIYLIHFDQSFKHARHYIGFTTDLDARLQAHASGHGARLMEVITNAGINWQCVRTWPGERKFERQLKRRKETPALCPVCAGDAAYKRADHIGGRSAAVDGLLSSARKLSQQESKR